jgi:hypothetical protein
MGRPSARDRDVWARTDWENGCRPPDGPRLLAKELVEAGRMDDTDAGRDDDDVDDANELWRDRPAIDVALTAEPMGREPGGAGAGLAGSPARSCSVFLFSVPGGGIMLDGRALLAEADSSASFPGDGMRVDGGWSRDTNCSID